MTDKRIVKMQDLGECTPTRDCIGERMSEQCERHNSILTYKRRPCDLFRKTFWLNCFYCDMEQGPYVESIARLRLASELKNKKQRRRGI